MIKLPYKLLIYDIETSLLKANLFRLGEQRITHNQLDVAHQENHIICIAAKWYGDKQIVVFEGDKGVEGFDKLAREADVCLGKNSNSFDVKYINTARMMLGLKPYPEWADTNDDLERQMRKYFALPSQSLDYISKIFGTGGKDKMEFADWVSIQNYDLVRKLIRPSNHTCKTLFLTSYKNVINDGKKALSKMIKYNKKDVLDTEAALTKVLPYIKLKRNASKEGKGCTTCGSLKIAPTKIIKAGQTSYQQFDCLEHEGYAGRCTFRYDKNRHKIYGRMQ